MTCDRCGGTCRLYDREEVGCLNCGWRTYSDGLTQADAESERSQKWRRKQAAVDREIRATSRGRGAVSPFNPRYTGRKA